MCRGGRSWRCPRVDAPERGQSSSLFNHRSNFATVINNSGAARHTWTLLRAPCHHSPAAILLEHISFGLAPLYLLPFTPRPTSRLPPISSFPLPPFLSSLHLSEQKYTFRIPCLIPAYLHPLTLLIPLFLSPQPPHLSSPFRLSSYRKSYLA